MKIDLAEEYARVPDNLHRTWVPHRLAYVKEKGNTTECVFCSVPKGQDSEKLIVARGESVYAVLNLYPYNSGHLLIVPYRHIATYDLADEAEIREMGFFVQRAMRMIKAVFHAEGFNIGMNQGSVAGAGIAQHLHQHIVPRWHGDSNFMPIIGKTKPMPHLLGAVWEKFHTHWNEF